MHDLQKLHYIQGLGPGVLPEGASVVEVPLTTGERLVALYLTPHPAVEQAIQSQGWRHVPVRRM